MRRSAPLSTAMLAAVCWLAAGSSPAAEDFCYEPGHFGRPHRVAPGYQGVVKIAAVQMASRIQDTAYNLSVMLTRAGEAAANGANLVVFPELALNAYKYLNTAECMLYAEAVPDGPSTQALIERAAELGVYIAWGMLERDGEDVFDSIVMVGPEGFVGKYRKLHMGYRSEALTFSRGWEVPRVYRTAIGRIGLSNCYDAAFPETARLLAVQGMDIWVAPNTENGTTWRDSVRTRAAENHFYAVTANRVGGERLSTFNGFSLIAGPDFNYLATAGTVNEEIIYASVDIGALGPSPFGNRRPELYGSIADRLAPQIISADLDPETQVTGYAQEVAVNVTTSSLARGTPITITLESETGAVHAIAQSELACDRRRVMLGVPGAVPAGAYTARIAVGSDTLLLPYTVKASAKPAAMGKLPLGPGAARSSSVNVSFDMNVKTRTGIPLQLIGPTGTLNLVGAVNNAGLDDRLVASYSNLVYGATYTVVVPADSVQSVTDSAGNDEVRFEFTVQPAPVMVMAAAVQMAPAHADVAANLAAVQSRLQQAKAAGVAFAVFPELTLTGNRLNRGEALSVAEPVPGPSVSALIGMVQTLGMHAVVGLAERAPRFCGHGNCGQAPGRRVDVFNTLVLVGPGGLVGKHRKTHLSAHEAGVFQAGDSPSPVYETSLGPVGLTFGNENYYPEVARSLAVRGALLMAGSYAEDGTLWPELARTRASESKVYMIAANRVGSENGASFGGRSVIARTSRGILAQAGPTAEQIIQANLDMYDITKRTFTYVDRATRKVRATDYYLDRRPHLYDSLIWHAGCAGQAPMHHGFQE